MIDRPHLIKQIRKKGLDNTYTNTVL
jgi:hypothetical protein